MVISPDEGASYFTENAQGHSLKKVRNESKAIGKNTGIHADIKKLEGDVDVKGKNICILDDIIATGGTIIRAIEHLKKLGANKIVVGATHGVFSGEKIPEKILPLTYQRELPTIQNCVYKDLESLALIALIRVICF